MLSKNIIVLMIDGGRLDRAKTSSFFNKIRSKSVFFSNSITYGPHTIAAMHAFFAGCYGIRTGTDSYWSTYKFKKNKFKTLTEYLKENDYYTCADIVSEIVIPKQGFDEFLIHDEKKDNLSDRHIRLLEAMKEKNAVGHNFFLFLQYSNIHSKISEEVLKVFNNFSKKYFENRELNEERYDRQFKKAENYLMNILEKITLLDLNKNSLILIMSDHGISVGEKIGERAYGAFCYDYTLRTFAYFLIPDFTPLEIAQQVRTIDFMPSILELLHLPLDKNYSELDGESLLPLIKGHKVPEKIAYSETGNPLEEKKPPKTPNTKSVRTSKWKLIVNEYNSSKELYDLENDPDENTNLIDTNLEIQETLWKKFLEIQSTKNKL
jgi:arylsulfatase A-like enzyme